jgi:ABC-type bacteriocin/lantibiotic exporter with double-glycine peptidase domain
MLAVPFFPTGWSAGVKSRALILTVLLSCAFLSIVFLLTPVVVPILVDRAMMCSDDGLVCLLIAFAASYWWLLLFPLAVLLLFVARRIALRFSKS